MIAALPCIRPDAGGGRTRPFREDGGGSGDPGPQRLDERIRKCPADRPAAVGAVPPGAAVTDVYTFDKERIVHG